MLEARDLYCERDERTLFRGLSFTVDAGEWVQVTGGNGAGKTTLLRLLTGLARPDGGEVYWQGEPLRRVRDSFHHSLLWIGHQPGIKSRLTARENLHFFHPGDGARLPEALAQAGLAGFELSLIHISEPTRPEPTSYAVFCLKKKTLAGPQILSLT
ncbi:heme ABC exporter ATP-binding protein CcmA, partial [Salmonella enterica]|uniref:heme ABC exporter ATP-binding protein CcmA n=2 Tax=Salmonella enterica TaxID=28901 RepID=UPI001E29A481